MTMAITQPPTSPRWFKWTLLAAWTVVYLHCMAQSGWAWSAGGGVMGFGFPGIDVLNAHGAAVPMLVRQGDWHRLLLDGLINVSLLGFVFTLWIWSSLGGMFLAIGGAARSWIVFLVGAAAGAFAHSLQHPNLPLAGAGATGAIMAATGALLLWGFTNGGALAMAARRRAVGYLVIIVVFTVAFALLTGSDLARAGTFELGSLLGGLVAGALVMLLCGVRRVPDAPGIIVRGIAVLGLLAFVYAVTIQAPKAFAGSEAMQRARDYGRKIAAVEQAAWKVRTAHAKTGRSRQAQLDETHTQRRALEEALAAVRKLPWLETFEGRELLFTYLDSFDGFVDLDYGLLSIQLARMKKAWLAYRPAEQQFLTESGVRFREQNIWSSEFDK